MSNHGPAEHCLYSRSHILRQAFCSQDSCPRWGADIMQRSGGEEHFFFKYNLIQVKKYVYVLWLLFPKWNGYVKSRRGRKWQRCYIWCLCVFSPVWLFATRGLQPTRGSSVHGILQARTLGGLSFPSPGDLPDPGIEPGSPAWQAVSLPPEPVLSSKGLWMRKLALPLPF